MSKVSCISTVCRNEVSSYVASDQMMMNSSNVSEEECSKSSKFIILCWLIS